MDLLTKWKLSFMQARKMKVLLPDLVNLLWQDYMSLAMKALMVLQNVMRHFKRTEASSIAMDLVKPLWPYFSEVRPMWSPSPERGPGL